MSILQRQDLQQIVHGCALLPRNAAMLTQAGTQRAGFVSEDTLRQEHCRLLVCRATHVLLIHTSKPASASAKARLRRGPLSTNTADDSSSPCCSSTGGLQRAKWWKRQGLRLTRLGSPGVFVRASDYGIAPAARVELFVRVCRSSWLCCSSAGDPLQESRLYSCAQARTTSTCRGAGSTL